MEQSINWFSRRLCSWLMREHPASTTLLCDFNRLYNELRPGDIVLVEGRSRVSNVIKLITQSSWTHAALYIGRIYDIEQPACRDRLHQHYAGDPVQKLLIEAQLGEGTLVVPVKKYRHHHLRICRPRNLSTEDARRVVGFTIDRLGVDYDVRQLLDLARFFFPWSFLPRRWRSSLFQHNAGDPTRTVCACLLAESFSQVDFPILPFIDRGKHGTLRFFKRNPKLFTPKDFDYSPYFDIIKYPYLELDDIGVYRKLPWAEDVPYYDDDILGFAAEIPLPIKVSMEKTDIGGTVDTTFRTTQQIGVGEVKKRKHPSSTDLDRESIRFDGQTLPNS